MKFTFLMLAALLAFAHAQPSTAWYDNAIAVNPDTKEFEISSAEDLRGLANLVNGITTVRFSGKTIKLTRDVDLGDENWTPIGNNSSTNNFLGTFDGQGHIISGLSVDINATASGASAAGGLFGFVGVFGQSPSPEGQIKNVNIVASKISVKAYSYAYAGGLVGYYRSEHPILNCHVKADSIISKNYVGGLVGYFGIASIRNSSVRANVVSLDYWAGGLVGYAVDNSGAGNNSKMEFSDNYTSGSVQSVGSTPYTGGLIGYLNNEGLGAKAAVVTNCYSSANILSIGGDPYAGGLIGRVQNAITIDNSYSIGDVTATAKGVTNSFRCGGLVGQWNRGSNISNKSVISNSYSSGEITILREASGNGNFYCGGLVGYLIGSASMTISNSYTSGKVTINKIASATGTYYMGGLIGGDMDNKLIEITNSYAGGNVLGVNDGSASKVRAGGIFGHYMYSEGDQITSVYYNSDSTSKFAGIICNSMINCDSSTTTLPGIFGKTEVALKKQETFSGWDFAGTWGITENKLMPYLRSINHVSNVDIQLPTRIYTYTGSPIEPKPEIWSRNTGTLLQENFDYYFVYDENTYAGNGTMTVIGKNAYDGLYRTIPITILPKELTASGAQVKTKIYDGTTNATIIGAILQGVCGLDDVHLINLTGTFASANAGTGISVTPHMTLEGSDIGNYFLTLPVLTGTIEPKALAENAIVPIFKQIYTGAELTPVVVVKDNLLTLIEDKDYTVSYTDNTEIGPATVTVTGINNYTGIITAKFEISDSHIPFVETFEYGSEWILVGTLTNKWAIGTATSNDGSYSAYISNNNGVANAYTLTSISTVHLYRDIVFPTSSTDFLMTFYAKGYGEASNDYMTLRYCAPSVTPTAGTATSNLLTNTNSTLLGTYQGIANWTLQTVSLPASVFSGKTMRLVFTWRNNGSAGTQPPAAIDDINIYIHPGAVSTPVLASKTHTSIAINAVASPATGQDVEYAKNTTSTPPTGASSWQAALEFTGLLPNTNYYIFARAKDDGTYPAGPISFTMIATEKAPPATVPFNETFESEANRKSWIIAADAGQANQWFFGSAARYGGSYGAYISENNGSANTYNVSSESVAHIYRDVTFPASTSDFTLTFYFRGYGEGDFSYMDYMEVRDAGTDVIPQTGLRLADSKSRLLGTYSKESDWTEKTITLSASTYRNTTRRLVFTWVNDHLGGMQPPAAIDNIIITAPDLPSSSSAKPSSSSSLPSSSSSVLSSSSVAPSSSSSLLSSSSVAPSSSSSLPSSSSSDGITVSLPRITINSIYAQVTDNAIVLGNVPQNAKIEVYNLRGERIYSANQENPLIMKIMVQTKGLYIVKAVFGSERKVIKVPVSSW
ncbi:MAG: YDG domain-containing protein [Fibromonadales bacterium]|nr:YDG domain-containing protein [Fibromonadales bacterium]